MLIMSFILSRLSRPKSSLGYFFHIITYKHSSTRSSDYFISIERISQKKAIYETYKEGFKNISEIEMMPVCDYNEPNYWLSVMTIKENSKVKPIDIMLALENENIESNTFS